MAPERTDRLARVIAAVPGDARGRGFRRVGARAFDVILRAGPLSRSRLRARLGVSPSTLTATVQELVERGLISEVGHAESTGGRPAGLLDLAPDLGCVLAADIGGINLRTAVGDCRGTLLHLRTSNIADAVGGRSLQKAVIEALDEARQDGAGPIRAIAISLAGIVDPRSGAVSRTDNIPGWDGDGDLSWLDRFGAPVVVDNEANLGALGEHRAAEPEDAANMLFVAVGAGVGAGMILDGRLYRGATGAAGELGLVHRGSPRDSVALERLAAAPAIVERYVAIAGEPAATAEDVFARAEAGDQAARQAIEEAAEELALGIANAVILLNPSAVVVGGGLGSAGERLLEPLKARLEPLVPHMPEVSSGVLGSRAAIVGAVHWAAHVAQGDMIADLEQPTIPVDG